MKLVAAKFLNASGSGSTANAIKAISLGSVCRLQRRLSSFSNYGAASVHIAAPGRSIFSTGLEGSYLYKSGNLSP